MTGPTEYLAVTGTAPAWLVDAVGGAAIVAAVRLSWGFSNETWRVETADGLRLTVMRPARQDAAAGLRRILTLAGPRLAAAGIPVPEVVDLPGAGPGIVVTRFVEGRPAAELLGEPGGPAAMGALLGTAWQRLGSVDPAGLPLDASWSTPIELASHARRWAASAEGRLAPDQRCRVDGWISRLPSLLDGRSIGFVHGDFVPVNVLVDGGRLAALVDLETARVGDRLLDAAWFRWIVGYHHPAALPAAWTAFADGAGLDERDAATRALLDILPSLRILEILADDGLNEPQLGHWTAMLSAALATTDA